MKYYSIFLLLLLMTAFGVVSNGEPLQDDYSFHYHLYDESTSILEGLAKEHPRLAKLYSIGKSVTGNREIWCIEIGNQDTGPAEDKPAIYFDANQHASEVTGGETALYLAHYLLNRYGTDADVKRLIDTRVVYIIQRADPDGAETYMTGKVDWDPEKIPRAKDADGDGRKEEDGPEDIDGEWKTYDRDARVMVRREDDDTQGPFYRFITEGRDNDGDGEVNEDPPRTGFISNRNYPGFWASPSGRYRGQGDYPLQEHNARILVDFILSKPHIAQIQSFHTTSGIHLYPIGARPDKDIPLQDLEDYKAVLTKGTAITTYPVASLYHDFTTIQPGIPPEEQPGVRHGVFIDWSYVHEGLFSITTELWTMEPFLNETGWGDIPRTKRLHAIPGRYNRPDVQAVVLKWLDAHKGDARVGDQGFIDWKAYDHPTLGKVEIGGFTRYWPRNPPPGPFLQKTVDDQAKFAVVHSLVTPIVKIQDVEVESAGAGKWKVTAIVANEGYLDTSTQQARIAGVAEPDKVTIELPEGAGTDDPETVEFDFLWGTRDSSTLSLYHATWNVEAPAGSSVTINLRSEKGGADSKEAVLN